MLYALSNLDREHTLRGDSAALQAFLSGPRLRLLVLWKELSLVRLDDPSAPWLEDEAARGALDRFAHGGLGDPIFLGVVGGCPAFALDVSEAEANETGPDFGPQFQFVSLRLHGPQTPAEAGGALAYARAMAVWHRFNRHCGVCGARTASQEGGHVRRCQDPQCGHMTYPRTDSAVIMLVEDDDRILMHRQKQWPPGMWSCLAGFVEPGETLEHAVWREVMEESGIEVDDVRYVASQPWPFPSSLMVAFTAKAVGGTLAPDTNEIEDARWFSVSDLKQFNDSNRQTGQGLFLAVPGSAARLLIDTWLKEKR